MGIDIESWQFAASESAEILGWSERQFANWTKRYSPFPHKKLGRGRSISYGLSDLMTLSAAAHLVEAGIAPEKAFAALAPYQGPYGSLLHDASHETRYPGTETFTRNSDGRWVGVDSPQSVIAIEIRAWPIFDKVFPRIKKAILSDPRGHSFADIRDAIKQFEDRIGDTRRERWSA